MRLKLLHPFFLIVVVVILLAACASIQDVEAPSRSGPIVPDTPATSLPVADTASTPQESSVAAAAIQAPVDEQGATPQAGDGELIYAEAQITAAKVAILESFPVQVNLIVQGNFPDGCTTVDQVSQRQQDHTFFVNLITARPAEAMCTQQIVPFEEIVALDVRGLKAGEYQVMVNEQPFGTFELAADNGLPNEGNSGQGVLPTDDTTYEPIFIPATGAAITVPAEWTRTDFQWSPNREGMPLIGVAWTELDLEWTPTSMLPEGAELVSREPVELAWGEGIRFQLEIKDTDGQLVTIEEHLIAPLNRTVVYDFYASGSTYQELDAVKDAYETMITSVELNANPAFQGLPESCTPNVARALFVDAGRRYCLLYPVYYPQPVEENGLVNISGLPQSEGPDPIVASLLIQIDGPANGQTVAQVVDQVVSQYSALPITRRSTTLSGVEAVLVEGLPGRFGSRQVFAVYNDTIFHFILMPVDNAFPQLADEVEQLWETTTTSFTFLP
ncbi:MAG: hypothetical protein H6631_13115 [Anaerolineaceae bacterium]|nr:hypothetical protein [Anaerolineaceae bacterium]MCB9099157.1 hypothetical protein [Anaerolineales bacterium]